MATKQELLEELAEVRARLEEAEETLRAIRQGEVDALVVSGPEGDHIFTLKGADHSYRILVETINEGAATLAADGKIFYANRRLAELLKMPLEKVITSAIRDYVEPTDRDVFEALFSRGKQGVSKGEVGLRAADGALVPTYVSLSSMQLEALPDMVCLAVTDLTDQKRDEALVAEGKLSQEILSQAEQAIAVCDESGRIIRASQGLHLLCEQNPLFLPFQQIFPLCLGSHESFSLDPLYFGKTLHNEEMYFCRNNGEPVYLLVNAGPLLDERHQPKGCVVAFTDITERQRSEQERQQLIGKLQQSEEELQAANEELRVQAEELQAQREELQQSHDDLEEQVKGRTAQVVASNEKLRLLTSQLLSAQEQERKRVAMELHDDLGQSLSVLKMQLRHLERQLGDMPQQQGECKESLKFINEIVEKVRRLSRELSPPILDDLGLLAALDHLFYEFGKYEGLKVSVEKADIKDLFPLEAQIGIYRIFQEALNNISKHSGATRVEIAIKNHGHCVEFSIEDNGQGFSQEELANRKAYDQGMGLAAMNERVRLLGGVLKLQSKPGQGTSLHFTIPGANQKL